MTESVYLNQATYAWRTTEASMFTLNDDTQVFCITHT